MTYVLGIDISTTATKAIVVDGSGVITGTGSAGYTFETPRPLWSEQDPNLWTGATERATQAALAEAQIPGEAVSAIGLTGQMHGLVLVDTAGRPLRPAILWNDQRTQAECDQMRAVVGKQRLIEITGNDALTGFTAPKLLWVRANEPEVVAAAARMLLPKDYVRLHLTGDHALDRAGGSGTQLFDLAQRDWSVELVERLALDPRLLPPTYEGPEITGTVSQAAAERTGLQAGTPVVAGGGDQAANAVGTGVVDPGTAALSLGTSGVIFAATDRPAIEPDGRVHAFCHAVPARWHLMGVMLSAAGSLHWYRDTVAPGMAFEELVAEAASVPPGADGLLFLPYLSGERTPHPDPRARGGFIGLTVRHTRPHLTRAVLEGVAFGLRDGLDLMRSAGLGEVEELRASGGGTRSALWRQILADVLQVDLVTVNTVEGAAYGAAILAAVGAGWFDQAQSAAAAWVRATGRTEFGETDYTSAHRLFAEQYQRLKPTFDALSQQTS